MSDAGIVVKPRKGSAFTHEDLRILRERFIEWKARHGLYTGRVTAHPTVRTGLASLHNDHGYSFADIALMLGVSRERVRQWFKEAGIAPRNLGGSMRVWDDDEGRFVLVSAKEYHKRVRRATEGLLPREIVPKRRRIARWVLVDLGRDLGRTPAHVDLVEAFGFAHASQLNSFLGCLAPRIGPRLDAIWRSAGYPERPNAATWGRGRPEVEHLPLRPA